MDPRNPGRPALVENHNGFTFQLAFALFCFFRFSTTQQTARGAVWASAGATTNPSTPRSPVPDGDVKIWRARADVVNMCHAREDWRSGRVRCGRPAEREARRGCRRGTQAGRDGPLGEASEKHLPEEKKTGSGVGACVAAWLTCLEGLLPTLFVWRRCFMRSKSAFRIVRLGPNQMLTC